MKLITAAALLLLVAVGLIFLANWDIPAPSQPVVKTLDNDRFPS